MNRDLNRALFGDVSRKFGTYFPEINAYENSENYVVIAKVPGIPKESIKISVKDNSLLLQTEKKSENIDDAQYHLRERKTETMERTVHFNDKVDADNIAAELQNGLLMVKIPKSPESKPKTITIR